MGDAHEDERADQDVERRAAGDQDQDALGVRRQPDVILADEQLGETKEFSQVGGRFRTALSWESYCFVHAIDMEDLPFMLRKIL